MIELTEITQTGHFCPSQWEGKTTDGLDVYIRYRWGHLSVQIGLLPGDDPLDRGKTIFSQDLGDGFDGTMTTTDMLKHTGITHG